MTTIIIISLVAITALVIAGQVRYRKNKQVNDDVYEVEEIYYIDESMEWEMYHELCDYRDSMALSPVVIDMKTSLLAVKRCYEMMQEGKASHKGFADQAFELLEAGADHVGENVAYGYGTAEGVMKAFWESEGHRKNMLNTNYDFIGIGAIRNAEGRYYFCILFGGDTEI